MMNSIGVSLIIGLAAGWDDFRSPQSDIIFFPVTPQDTFAWRKRNSVSRGRVRHVTSGMRCGRAGALRDRKPGQVCSRSERCAGLYPGIVLHLMRQKGLIVDRIENPLHKDGKLEALSGVRSDVRDFLASPEPRAGFAVDYSVRRIAAAAGALTPSLGGPDDLVFTAGIGEKLLRWACG